MKPIEPGCRCLIIKDDYVPENVGKVVTVIERCRKGTMLSHLGTDRKRTPLFCTEPFWIIGERIRMLGRRNSSALVEILDVRWGPHSINGMVYETRLIRIDGGDFDDNPYQEKKPISDVLDSLQAHWINSPETWDEYQRRVQHG